MLEQTPVTHDKNEVIPMEVVNDAVAAYGQDDPERLLEAVQSAPQLTVGQKLQAVDGLNGLVGIKDASEVKRELVRQSSQEEKRTQHRHLLRTRAGIIALRYR